MDQSRTPIGGLLAKVIEQATQLFKAEVTLLRLEAAEKVRLAIISLISLLVAAVFIIVALIILVQGLVELLFAKGIAAYAASFLVGGGIALIAIIAIVVAARNLSPSKLKPARAIAQVDAARQILRGPQ